MAMMKLAVIVSSYNRERFLKEALESVAKQTMAKEIYTIVVDDASDFDAEKLLAEYSESFGASKVIKIKPDKEEDRANTNRVAFSVNSGLRFLWSLGPKEKPEYISYLGDDDLYFSNRCERLVSFLDKQPDIFLVYHFMEIFRCDKEGKLGKRVFILKDAWTEANKYWVEHIYNRIDHIGFVHRDRNYLWDEDSYFRRASDWGFLLRCLALEEKFAHIPEWLAMGRKIEGDSLNVDGSQVAGSRGKEETK